MITIETMERHRRSKILSMIFLLWLVLGSSLSCAQEEKQDRIVSPALSSHDIIQEGIRLRRTGLNPSESNSDSLKALTTWYNQQPSIEYACLIQTSITVRFIDGSAVVLFDPLSDMKETNRALIPSTIRWSHTGSTGKTAVILNPAESMYGHFQCQQIISLLMNRDYTIDYVANQAVDLCYVKNNLSATIIYMNTHAGYFDIDGDSEADAVVIATGELWTNETDMTYAYEIQNHLIVKGMVGDLELIAFTPAFIEEYYTETQFPDSLVFMATCYALTDTSMAQEFLDAGARVYLGWSQNTVFWTNSRTSVQAFRLLSYGFDAQQVCRLIRSGGFYNWLFHSKLTFAGDGTYRLP
jgi:hypothetical protein